MPATRPEREAGKLRPAKTNSSACTSSYERPVGMNIAWYFLCTRAECHDRGRGRESRQSPGVQA